MGTFFSVYSTTELMQLSQRQRKELKSAIEWVLQHDPDVANLIANELPALRGILKRKTQPGFERLAEDAGNTEADG
jgi:hypothetical protein